MANLSAEEMQYLVIKGLLLDVPPEVRARVDLLRTRIFELYRQDKEAAVLGVALMGALLACGEKEFEKELAGFPGASK